MTSRIWPLMIGPPTAATMNTNEKDSEQEGEKNHKLKTPPKKIVQNAKNESVVEIFLVQYHGYLMFIVYLALMDK